MSTIYTVKRDGETNERLIKRSKKSWQQARKRQELLKRRYRRKDPNSRKVRQAAIKSAEYREKRAREQFYA